MNTIRRNVLRDRVGDALRCAPLPEEEAAAIREWVDTASRFRVGIYGGTGEWTCPIVQTFGVVPSRPDDPRHRWALAFDAYFVQEGLRFEVIG